MHEYTLPQVRSSYGPVRLTKIKSFGLDGLVVDHNKMLQKLQEYMVSLVLFSSGLKIIYVDACSG